jgi:hypothetical protein
MQHTDFPGRNAILMPPVGSKDVQALHVRRADGMVMSVWTLSDDERAAIAAGGAVCLFVQGDTHPPVAITVSPVE